MKSNPIINLCFLIPFVFTVFNAQSLVSLFVSPKLAQVMAYGNLGFISVGLTLILKNRGTLSKTASLWVFFYIIYFDIAILAGVLHNNNNNIENILINIIPLFYVLGFYIYLSIPENRKLFQQVALVSFVLSSILGVYFFSINFDLDKRGVYIYAIDRAQGVFGDANNMAIVSIISFVFVYRVFQPENKYLKIFRLILLATMFYSLFITFSNTGFMVFILALVMLNYKFFKGAKIIVGLVLLPVLYMLLLNLNNITANMNLIGQQRDKINNIVNILSFKFDKVDDSGRNELVSKLLGYVYENPLLGNGVGFGIAQHGHNTIVGIWADAGIFTLLFFLFMLGAYFKRTIESAPDVRYFVLPILITLCIFMLSLHSVINQPYLIALFIYIGYLVDDKTKEFV